MEIFSPVCRDPGRLLPRSRQTGLKIFHVIASQIFTDFVQTAGISLEKLNPLNRAILSHVIGASVRFYNYIINISLGYWHVLKSAFKCFQAAYLLECNPDTSHSAQIEVRL